MRHLKALQNSQESLERAISAWQAGISADLFAIDLREALIALGEITGETVTEDIIDKIFAEFCIGK